MYVYTNNKTPKTIVPVTTITNWSGFSVHPSGQGVKIYSDSDSDNMVCTIFGTTNGTNKLAYEQVQLRGTGTVTSVKTDWGNIYSVILARRDGQYVTNATGTITIKTATSNSTITTITAGSFISGMMMFYLPGLNVCVTNLSGNMYWNVSDLADSTTGIAESGKTSFNTMVKDYLSLISDNTGASLQVVVLEN